MPKVSKMKERKIYPFAQAASGPEGPTTRRELAPTDKHFMMDYWRAQRPAPLSVIISEI